VKRGEKDVFPSPSKGYQAWNLPRATKLGSSIISFLLLIFKSTNLDHLGYIFGHNFQFEYLDIYSYNFPWEKKSD
jgi:hypothetical protein